MENRSRDRHHEPRSPLVDLFRLGSTYRWQVVHLSKRQTVAEHSHMVSLLVLRFCQIMNLEPGPYLAYAILHDAEEAWIGDIATPAKRMMDKDKIPYQAMLGHLWDFLPEHDLTRDLVKLADCVEAMRYLRVYGEDGRHAEIVYEKIEATMHQYLELVKYVTGTEIRPISYGLCELEQEIEDFINGRGETFADDYI